ncbi:hypothetical protein Tco_1234954 [Tanacetum coccineum]
MILTTNTPYPSRKIRRIRACTYQRPQRKQAQYTVSRRPICRIQDIVCEYSGRYQAWSLLQETPNTPYPIPWIRRTLLDPFQFPYPKRRLTMEEIVNKFIKEGKREHEKMDAFIREFRTTNELLLKERNNLLS